MPKNVSHKKHDIRQQHGTASTVSATQKWCRSLQVSCWAVHVCKCGKIVKPTAWLRMRVQLYRSVCLSPKAMSRPHSSPLYTNNPGRKRPTQQPSTIFLDPTTVWATHFLIGWSPTKYQITTHVLCNDDQKRPREVTLQTSAIDVCKCGKTMFAALKRERGRRAGKGRKRQTWSWKKTFQLLWTPCRTCSQQVAYSQIDRHERPICKWCKEQLRCLSSKEPNTDKLRDKLGEIFGMELSSF